MANDIPDDDPGPIVLTRLSAPHRGGFRLQHMMYLVGICAFIFWIGIVAGIWLVSISAVLLVTCAIGAAVVFARRGAVEQESLLWAMAIAAEKSLPLAPAAMAFTEQYSRSFRWRVRLLTSLLSEGIPLPDALDQMPRMLSRESMLLLRSGWATGTLPLALREAANARSARRTMFGAFTARYIYLFAVLYVAQLVVGFIMYFIAPKYEAIFKDFGMRLPELTKLTIQVSHWLIDVGWPLLVLVLLELLAMGLLPIGLLNIFQWDIPLIDALFRRRHTALLLKALALSVEGNRPLTTGLEVMASEYPSGWVRRRLRKVVRQVREGADWVASLRGQGLINQADAAVLSSAQRVGNLAWALRETSSSAERRLSYRLQFWLQILFPVVVMAMGTLVFFYAVAYFMPLVRLIEALAT